MIFSNDSEHIAAMNNLPEKALKNVAEYLPRIERAFFAVALTAPSASWETCDSAKALPSKASKIVMENPYYKSAYPRNVMYKEKWEGIDYYDFEQSVAANLTDGDVRGILTCIDAKNILKLLHLPRLINIRGNGLSPLCGTVVLDHLDVSMVREYESDVVKPMLSKDAVIPILNSIIETEGNSLKYIRLPKTWRANKSEILSQFLDTYNQVMNACEVDCSGCGGMCIGTAKKPWVSKQGEDYGVQQLTCHNCLNQFCHECEISCEVECCPCCEMKSCKSCIPGIQECSICHTTGCQDGCNDFYTCDKCSKVECEGCNSSFYCYSCDQLICEGCASAVKCQGYTSCYYKSCIDCEKKGTGQLKQCTSCGKGFCSTGKSPECHFVRYCHHLEGNVCSGCHVKEHDITDCYLQSLPAELQELLPDSTDMPSFDKLVEFWQKCTQLEFFVPDKDFDHDLYGQVRQARATSCKLAIEYLLQSQDSKAVSIMFFCGLMREIEDRGPDHIVQAFESAKGLPSGPKLCHDCGWFSGMVHYTTSRESIVDFIQKEMDWKNEFKEWEPESKWFLEHKLSKLKASTHKLHDMKDIRDRARAEELKCIRKYTYQMEIIVTNLDSGKRNTWWLFEGLTMGWFLKHQQFKCNYDSCLGGPKITTSTKYFRMLHKGKTLFLSSAGKKSLHQLGIRGGDEITIGGVETEDNIASASAKRAKAKPSKSKKSKKSNGSKRRKQRQPKVQVDQLLTEEQIVEKHRKLIQRHSHVFLRS